MNMNEKMFEILVLCNAYPPYQTQVTIIIKYASIYEI